jgi:plasmid stabilization system protein ParE
MILRLLTPAKLEVISASEYYEGEQVGLGEGFWLELDAHLQWILQNPTLPRLRRGLYRRVNLDRFPYHIAYILREEEIVVVAVPCSYRKPEYWIDRLMEGEQEH